MFTSPVLFGSQKRDYNVSFAPTPINVIFLFQVLTLLLLIVFRFSILILRRPW